jgi:hypothetical protein
MKSSSWRNGYAVVAGGARRVRRASKDGHARCLWPSFEARKSAHLRMTVPIRESKRRAERPAVFVSSCRCRAVRVARAEREAPPEPSKLLLLGFLCLLGLLRCLLLRFLSHSILFWVNGWKRDTEACSGRASLATASIVIRTDSRGAFARRHTGVIALSTAVMRFIAFFRRVIVIASQRVARMRAR